MTSRSPKKLLFIVSAFLVSSVVINAPTANAAACVPPPTDYGTVTQNISVSSAGIYRVWTRMAAPSASDNTYLLDIDSTDCYTVGGSTVPVHGGSAPYCVAGTSNWIARTSGGSFIDVNLSVGTHAFKMIGEKEGVVVDKILLTKDTACTPATHGDNCAVQYYKADINQDADIDFLDFSSIASTYSQTGGGIGRNDINEDGVVNFQDFSVLGNFYGR